MSVNNATTFISRSRREVTLPLGGAIAIYAGVFAIQLCEILRLTQGHQLYPLDDVYIHAAVAKNLLLHHVYGISPFGFSFPSSSILWPFILTAAFAVVGVKAWVPLALNFLFSIVYLVFADHVLRSLADSISPRMRFVCLLLLVLGMPLVGLTFEGMEHVLHSFSILLLLYCYNRTQICPTARWRVLLPLSAVFAVGLRYESLFAVFMITLLLAWHREWLTALVVGMFAMVPVVAFGLFSLLHGSTFLPLPLLLKTSPLHPVISPDGGEECLFGLFTAEWYFRLLCCLGRISGLLYPPAGRSDPPITRPVCDFVRRFCIACTIGSVWMALPV